MPRKARQKSPEAIYHIMCRSVSEVDLFRDDDDKERYIYTLKKNAEKYKCKVYAFCIMDNHLHFQLDPNGFDISRFMKCVNVSYVRYYNKKYNRHGPLFQDRFESRILDTNEYALNVSAYIHNNPKDIEGYNGKEETYKHSSYAIYLGLRKDIYNLIDMSFIMDLFDTKDRSRFAEKYFAFVSNRRYIDSFRQIEKPLTCEVEYEYESGRQVILRDIPASKVISYISNRLMGHNKDNNKIKPKRRQYEFRAFTAYALRVLSGLSYKEICSNLYNITISGCARLCDKGYELLIKGDSIYSEIYNELISNKI